MGNSHLGPHWSFLTALVPSSIQASSADPVSFTSTDTYQQYTVVAVLDIVEQRYEVRDGRDQRFEMRVFQVEDFEEVRKVKRYVEFLREKRGELEGEEIVEVIVETTSSCYWDVVVITTISDFITLDTWLAYLNSISLSLAHRPTLALEDILKSFISLLEHMRTLHQHGFLFGRVHPQSLQIVRNKTEFALRFNYLQPECLGAVDAPRKTVVSPPEGSDRCVSKDVWDLGVTLLMVSTDIGAPRERHIR